MSEHVYRPSYLVRNGHFQSIWCGLLTIKNTFAKPYVTKKQLVQFKDGGVSSIDWRPDCKGRPLVVIIPGFLSSIEDHYIRTFIGKLEAQDYDWCVCNYRGVVD